LEGTYWLRIGAVASLVAGCVYVLLPTFLADREIDVDVGGGAKAAERPLEVWFTTDDKQPDPADAPMLEARLRAAGLQFERVEAASELLKVHLRTGTSKEAVTTVATAKGARATYALDAVVGVDLAAAAAAPSFADAVAAQLDGKSLVAGATPVTIDIGDATRGAQGALSIQVKSGWPEAAKAVVFTVNDRPVGVIGQPGPDGLAPVRLAKADAAADAALLATGELPEPLVRFVPPKEADPAANAKKDEPKVEAWWAGLLPDKQINLGLDLQGGIDLTLQVDLDEAVFAQVRRDQTALIDQATRDGFEAEITRDRSRAAMRVASTQDFAKVKEWMGTNLRSYNYAESITEEGKSWHVWTMQPDVEDGIRASAVEQVVETLRKRVDSTGVREPSIVKLPGGRINIQLPGVKDSQAAVDAVGTQAVLEFRLVDKDAGVTEAQALAADAKGELPADQYENDQLLNDWLHDNKKLPNDRALLWEYEADKEGKDVRSTPYIVHDQVLLTGGDVARAGTNWDQDQQPYVQLEFKPQGARVFCDVTTAHVKEQFAIILDHQIKSAPSIREKICGGSASIEMGGATDPMRDANNLSLVLRTGSLTAPVDVGEVREIGPNLGKDAIESGALGALVGGSLTFLFMLVWYRTAGLVANIALALNVLMVFALLAMFDATLTLPGIAGVALTIGMAVDANIIVYERIREELAVGRTARSAVDNGFNMGVTAVIDANLTTAIAGIVLYSYGTGPIKGFAVTLLIGIFTTIITGVFVTRWLLEVLTRNSNARLGI
jgi:preprotein translocase subunit SecD